MDLKTNLKRQDCMAHLRKEGYCNEDKHSRLKTMLYASAFSNLAVCLFIHKIRTDNESDSLAILISIPTSLLFIVLALLVENYLKKRRLNLFKFFYYVCSFISLTCTYFTIFYLIMLLFHPGIKDVL